MVKPSVVSSVVAGALHPIEQPLKQHFRPESQSPSSRQPLFSDPVQLSKFGTFGHSPVLTSSISGRPIIFN